MKAEVISLGLRIRNAREKIGISQIELGKRVGKSKQLICAWEAGRAEMTATMLVKVALALSVDTGWLADGKGGVSPACRQESNKRDGLQEPLEVSFRGLQILIGPKADVGLVNIILNAMKGSR